MKKLYISMLCLATCVTAYAADKNAQLEAVISERSAALPGLRAQLATANLGSDEGRRLRTQVRQHEETIRTAKAELAARRRAGRGSEQAPTVQEEETIFTIQPVAVDEAGIPVADVITTEEIRTQPKDLLQEIRDRGGRTRGVQSAVIPAAPPIPADIAAGPKASAQREGLMQEIRNRGGRALRSVGEKVKSAQEGIKEQIEKVQGHLDSQIAKRKQAEKFGATAAIDKLIENDERQLQVLNDKLAVHGTVDQANQAANRSSLQDELNKQLNQRRSFIDKDIATEEAESGSDWEESEAI